MLGDSHAPDETRTAVATFRIAAFRYRRTGENAGGGADVIVGNASDGSGAFRCVLVNDGAPFVVGFSAVGHEIRVGQTFRKNDVGQGVEQGHVGARIGTQPQVGIVAHINTARVDDDELGPALHHGPAHPRGGHRMVGRGVAADHHQTSGSFIVGVGIAGCPAAE